MGRQKTLEKLILQTLENYPSTRNDDIDLQLQLIQDYSSGICIVNILEERFIALSALREFREDTIKRIRAKVQNADNRFLPSNEDVRRRRNISEEAYTRYLTKTYGK